MLRVGLTGGLASGKSTVAGYLRALGAEVIEADELGRALMEPGQRVFAEIVRVFGPEVVRPDGRLNRARLSEFAFKDNRIDELNRIVHPAVIVAQQLWMDEVFARDPAAVAVVESALIFEVERDARARGETDTNDSPGATIQAFWEPLTTTSSFQSSVSNGTAPRPLIASTMTNASGATSLTTFVLTASSSATS